MQARRYSPLAFNPPCYVARKYIAHSKQLKEAPLKEHAELDHFYFLGAVDLSMSEE